MTTDRHLSSEAVEALRTRFKEQSNTAQAYYTVMHKVREVVGNDDAASAWMNEPLPALEGKTPAQLVKEGRADNVLKYIDAMRPGSAG